MHRQPPPVTPPEAPTHFSAARQRKIALALCPCLLRDANNPRNPNTPAAGTSLIQSDIDGRTRAKLKEDDKSFYCLVESLLRKSPVPATLLPGGLWHVLRQVYPKPQDEDEGEDNADEDDEVEERAAGLGFGGAAAATAGGTPHWKRMHLGTGKDKKGPYTFLMNVHLEKRPGPLLSKILEAVRANADLAVALAFPTTVVSLDGSDS